MSTSISGVGTGYLGVTHAACLAEPGHDVPRPRPAEHLNGVVMLP